MNDALGNHPRCPQPQKAVLEWLIKSDVDGLTDGGASSWDVLDLHPKLLDILNYRCHHVASVAVKDEDRDDVFRNVTTYGRKTWSTHASITVSSIHAAS